MATRASVQWFPGHMAKATRAIQQRLKAVDAVVEVRDARAPWASGNATLNEMLRHKTRIVALHKAELADANHLHRTMQKMRMEGIDAMATSRLKPKSIEKLLHAAKERLGERFPSAHMLLAMVVGVPNVGKSTLINAMRGLSEIKRTRKAAVGPLPGVTRDLAAFQIGTKPIVYLLDTPGIMVPKVADEETGLKLASIGVIKDSIVGEEKIAEFLLEMLSQHKSMHQRLGNLTLDHSRTRLNKKSLSIAMDAETGNKVNVLMNALGEERTNRNLRSSTCRQIVRLFREGKLGQISLDVSP
mmetsp:Transcript_3986/g.25096  ORF Transcript_3986/g.25096 Transcript_3986/m.25096 type:complete len:300 (-) Transcript_3986:871-1770(-)